VKHINSGIAFTVK
jgi:hypothetical protein